MNLAVYLMGMLVFTSGFYFVRKSECVWNGVCHIFVSYIVWMAVQSLLCEVNVRLGYRVIAWQYGIVGLLIGSCLWVRILKKKQSQRYFYSWLDAFVVVVLLISVLSWGWYQFGPDLEKFNFASIGDSAQHLAFARDLTGNFKQSRYYARQYFAAVNAAVWMSALQGIIGKFYQYKVFVCFELSVFLLNGVIFWTAIRRFLKKPFVIVIGILLTFFYLFGHPCNSLVYGTSYLSTGIMLSILIYYIASLLIYQKIGRIWGIGLLVLAEIGLLCSYKMYMPVFLCGTLLYLYYLRRIKRKKMTIWRIYLAGMVWGIIAILGIIGLFHYYTYLNLESDFIYEMYGHFYMDYLFLIPFILLLLKRSWKKKKIGLEEFLFILNLCFVIALFIGVLDQKVSTYYFYKAYVTLWGLAFLEVVKYFSVLKKKNRDISKVLLVCWIVLLTINVTGVDQSLYQKNENFKRSEEVSLFPIYTANLSLTQRMDDYQELNELIMAAAQIECEKGVRVPYVSSHGVRHDWVELDDWHLYIRFVERYHALTGRSTEWWYHSQEELTVPQLKEGGFQYVLLTCEYHGPRCLDAALKDMAPVDVIKKNSYGCLVAVHPYSYQALGH